MRCVSDSAPPPYGGPPAGPYGQQPYYPPPDHPQAVTVLILGILGLVLCQVLSPFAWVIGNRALREIDASGGRLGGRGQVNAGRICGIVGSVLLIVAAASLLVAALGLVALGSATFS
jgi:hypothetical protein